ncbi:predicted protein [Histoplasma capsulatum H143]|uniref:Uncharacterized protein n=1 Tax=Ajellomyces capsulatus (strain H143) TaxID=544712 RepID=C6HID6_AJECH|nr:predicted protein [Histoplasma capsulatum H143]
MDDSSLYALISQIRHSDFPEEWKELIIGLGITKDQLAELAEAATTVGYLSGMQDHRQPGRPIFALSFYGKLVAVAILIGSNGFVVVGCVVSAIVETEAHYVIIVVTSTARTARTLPPFSHHLSISLK